MDTGDREEVKIINKIKFDRVVSTNGNGYLSIGLIHDQATGNHKMVVGISS